MTSKPKMLAVICALLYLPALAQQPAMPDGKGKAEVERSCMDCHGPDIVLVRKTPEDWRKTVIDMAGRGGNSTPEEINNMVAYLSKYFGIVKPAATASPSPTERPSTLSLTSARLAHYLTVLPPAH